MSQYALLLACYRSGQMNERQWQRHLEDEVFAAWVNRNVKRQPGSPA